MGPTREIACLTENTENGKGQEEAGEGTRSGGNMREKIISETALKTGISGTGIYWLSDKRRGARKEMGKPEERMQENWDVGRLTGPGGGKGFR